MGCFWFVGTDCLSNNRPELRAETRSGRHHETSPNTGDPVFPEIGSHEGRRLGISHLFFRSKASDPFLEGRETSSLPTVFKGPRPGSLGRPRLSLGGGDWWWPAMPVSGRTLCCSVSGWRLGAAPLSAAAGPAVAFPWQLGVTGGLAGIRLGQWGRMLLVESHVFLAVRWFGIPFFLR